MRALITGGAGFIGSHLTDFLLHAGHEVIVIDNLKGGSEKNLKEAKRHSSFSFVLADIRDTQAIAPHFACVDWVFHLAALADIVPSIEEPRAYFETNVGGTFNVLECAKRARVKRLVYAASSSCYGLATEFPTPETAQLQPQYPYALTKMLGEELALHWHRVYQLPVLILRLFNVYGPRARTSGCYGAVFGVFLAQKLHGRPFTVVGDGTQTRDFTYVSDVAAALYAAAEASLSGEIFNVGSGGHYSVNRVVELLGGPIIHIPKRPGEPECTFADTTKIKSRLGWQPRVSLEEGVARLALHIDEFKDAPLWEPQSIAQATASWFHHLGEKVSCS